MVTLRERLEKLADVAPTGGRRRSSSGRVGSAHYLRVASLAATVLVVGAIGTGVGARLAGSDDHRPDPAPTKTVGIALPIEYPQGEEVADLEDAPGPLAAVWLTSGEEGGIYATDDGAP